MDAPSGDGHALQRPADGCVRRLGRVDGPDRDRAMSADGPRRHAGNLRERERVRQVRRVHVRSGTRVRGRKRVHGPRQRLRVRAVHAVTSSRIMGIMRVVLLVLALLGCTGPAAPVDAGDWVFDAAPITNCDQVPASVTIGVSGGATIDTHLACIGSLTCGPCGFHTSCVDGRLRVWESGGICVPDAGAADAAIDAGR